MHKIDCEELKKGIPTIPIKCNLCNEEIRSCILECDIMSIQCPKTSQVEFRIVKADNELYSFSCNDITLVQEKEYDGFINKGKKACTIENQRGDKIHSFKFGLVDVNTKKTKTYFIKNNLKTLNLWVFDFNTTSKELTARLPEKLIEPGKRGVVRITWDVDIRNRKNLDATSGIMVYPVPTKTAPELKPLYPKKVWVSA